MELQLQLQGSPQGAWWVSNGGVVVFCRKGRRKQASQRVVVMQQTQMSGLTKAGRDTGAK
jgi:hypothetical protein